jgi:hypothetical protein
VKPGCAEPQPTHGPSFRIGRNCQLSLREGRRICRRGGYDVGCVRCAYNEQRGKRQSGTSFLHYVFAGRMKLVKFRMSVNTTIRVGDADFSASILDKFKGLFDRRRSRAPFERQGPG